MRARARIVKLFEIVASNKHGLCYINSSKILVAREFEDLLPAFEPPDP